MNALRSDGSHVGRRRVPPAGPLQLRRPANEAIELIALAVAYFVLAKLGLTLASLHPSASPIWPPSGLALAAFLLWGNRVWAAVAVGAFMANATTFGSTVTSLAIAAGNTTEAFVTAWLLKTWSDGVNTFRTPAGVAKFAGLALAPGTMVSATVGVGSLVLAGHADAAKFTGIWTTWWLGDVGGQVIVAPAIVLWATARRLRLDGAELQRLAALLGATVAVGVIAFSPLLEQTPLRGPLAFLAIAPMLWAALRFRPRHTATAALVLSAFAVWGTLANGGPFAGPSLNDSFLLTLTFVISVAVPSLVLSADVTLRRESEADELSTDVNGVATIDLPDGNYYFDAEHEGYISYWDGSFSVIGEKVDVPVKLEPFSYTVTFVVQDDNTPTLITDAEIDIYTSEMVFIGSVTTDSYGEATIDLINGSYKYQVYDPYGPGYVSGDFEVINDNLKVDVYLPVS